MADAIRGAIQSARVVVFGDDEQSKLIRRGVAAFTGIYVGVKFINFLRFKRRVNKMIPGPDGDWESMKELYKANLGDFWGFNVTLLTNLHNQYGKVVKLWLGGQPYISFIDCEDIAQVNLKAVGRPPLTENLLPFLGRKNLLFQPTAHDGGAFVKCLRLKYGNMVQADGALHTIHRVALEVFPQRTAHWGSGAPIKMFDELIHILYDIMGTTLFGGAWSAHENGQKIITTHRFLIEGSASLGLSCCEHFTFGNLMKMPGDYMRYQKAIKDFHAVLWDMIQQRRREVQADPQKWAGDQSALTMLVTEKDEKGKPFFDKVLAISTCAGFLNGAFDTTHLTTFWLMYHLATNPGAQEKLRAEIEQAFPNKSQPTFEAVRNLKLLDATLKESLRARVTVPLGMRGNYQQDTKIGDIVVPKGATILPFTNGAHQDTKYFGADVDKFRPERFLGDGAEAVKARKAWHGFGGGTRMCVGNKFAEAEIKAIFTYFLQRYTIELADPEMPSPEMQYESGCNAPKERFMFIFKPR